MELNRKLADSKETVKLFPSHALPPDFLVWELNRKVAINKKTVYLFPGHSTPQGLLVRELTESVASDKKIVNLFFSTRLATQHHVQLRTLQELPRTLHRDLQIV